MNNHKNKYNITSEDYGIGYTFKNEEFYFDLEDYNLIKNYIWHKDKDGYLVANSYDENNNRIKIKMHRLILNAPKDKVVDHINHIIYDNRKNNLRICTQAENNKNIKLRKDNISGIIGVTWDKERNKWRSRIRINKKRIHLGLFDNLQDAINARKMAEIKYYGKVIQ